MFLHDESCRGADIARRACAQTKDVSVELKGHGCSLDSSIRSIITRSVCIRERCFLFSSGFPPGCPGWEGIESVWHQAG
jgi:hypothetical protein